MEKKVRGLKMVRSVLKRFSALVLSLALMLTMMPLTAIPAYAADLDIGIAGLGVSTDGGNWEQQSGKIIGSVTTEVSSGCGDKKNYTAVTGKITFKNNTESKAILKYTASLSSGSGSMDDPALGSIVLESGGSTIITVTSSEAGEDTSVVTISGITLTPVKDVTVDFVPSEHGSYTVEGKTIDAITSITQSSDKPFNVKVTPDEGYQFVGWKATDGKILSTSTSKPLYVSENTSITAAFVSADTAIFYVDGECFEDLNEATAYATNHEKDKIVLVGSGTLPAGNYSIPAGKVFLIPYEDTLTSVISENVIYNSYTTPTAFKELTMAPGAHIDVNGSISLGSEMSAKGQMGGYNGTPTGPDGRIKMNTGSSITVNNGGNLYAYGFISGDGSVKAKSGAKVYENFQIKDWRGGTKTFSISSYAFPLSQYYVQNIEIPLTLEAGAKEICNSSVNASETAYPAQIEFIGSGGMFQINSGTIIKEYNAESDRLNITIDGVGRLNSVSLSGLPIIGSVNSSDFELPINSNITVRCNSGSKVSIGQNVKLLPSAELDIEAGATATIESGAKAYLYDKDDWGNFTGTNRLYVVGYSVANGTAAKRNANGLTDAKINVNGILNVEGSLFTSNGGADIISSNGTGKVIFGKKPTASTTIYEMANNSTKTGVAFTAAKLHNGERYAGTGDEYMPTADLNAGTEVPYSKVADRWGDSEKITVSFDANEGGTGTMEAAEVEAGSEYTVPENGFTATEGKSFTGWNTKDDGTGTSYAAGAPATFTEDTTLFAQWTTSSYNVTFNANGHGTVPDAQTVKHGEKAVKPADPTETGWKFGGWYTEAECTNAYNFDTPVKATLTLYAKWTEDTATVTFMSQDGKDVLGTETVAIGQKPAYNAKPPVKEGTAQYEYAFAGWATSKNQETGESIDMLPAVTGDITYYAAFSKETKKYTIVFQNEDGKELQKSEVAYGEKPDYSGETPSKADDKTYTYTFSGWDKEIDVVSGPAIYTATYDADFIDYTVTFYEEDGKTKVSEESGYHFGDTVVIPDAPEKSATAEKTYTFDKWVPEVQTVSGNASYRATYTEELNKYNVYWVSDGTTIETDEDVEYGSAPSFNGSQPAKEKTAQYSYEFVGWNTNPDASTGVDLSDQTITGHTTYYAIFKSTVNSYTVTFVDEDGTTVLDKQTLEYGEIPKYKGEEPSKASDAQYDYTWTGWDKGLAMVTEDVTYTAVYDKAVKSYTITFMDEDGETVLSTQSVNYGDIPEYAIGTPTKAGDAQYSYEFDGWTPELARVTGEATYKAKFRKSVNSYIIRFVDEDGTTVLDQQSVEYGKMPVYKGETPEKEGTAEFAYEFSGWTPELAEVTAEATYKATYSKTVKTYSVKFMDEDGETVLAEQMVEYGKTPVYNGETPTKKGSAEYSYEFSGWTPELSAISGEATYTAVFKEVKNKYTVKFVDEDGTTVLDEQLVEYGSVPEYKGADPKKQATAQYSYTFAGWDKEIVEVTGEAVYKATYSKELRKYSIRFLDDDGTTVLDKQTVEYGKTPKYAGDEPEKAETAWATYDFIGWSPELVAVTGDADYTASYKENKKFGWITDDGKTYFVKDDGELAKGTFKTTAKDGSHDATFAFDPETGEFRKDLTGVYTDGTDYYWVDNGEVRFEEGLVRISETQEYYYFGEDGKAYKGETKWVKKNNDLLPQWDYTFGDDGIIVHEDVDIDGPTKVDEETYYYIDGIRVHMGLVKDGDDYYYYKRDGLMVRDSSYWISRLNGLDAEDDRISEKSYQFDETGKMILPMVEDKNGIYEEDGSLYYYEDGKRTYAGLIEIDDSYYYVKTSGEVVHGKDYWITKTNGLMAEKSYTFDDEGKMVIVSKKNGIIEEDGKLFYYKDDQKTYAGLFELDGNYYYAKTSGEIVCGRSYWVSKTNGLMPEKSYTFDEAGKMIDPDVVSDTQLNGIIKDGDNLFYYVDGVKTYAGLIEIDGDYYYVKTDGSVIHGTKYWITKTNGLMKEGSYTFDNDGKMVR